MFALGTKYEFDSGEAGVLFVDLPGNWTLERLAERLYNRCREQLLNCSALVVRLSVGEQHSDDEVSGLNWTPLCQRLPNQSIYALYSTNFEHRLSRNFNPDGRAVLDVGGNGDLIDRIRHSELEYFARSSNAILQVNDSAIFRLPSQNFSRKFMRVGNIQTRKPAIDAVFFWMLPWLKNTGAIITETWTISSISLNVSRLLARYSSSTPCRVDMISEYHDGSTEILEQLEAAIERASGEGGRILFLISACMSGKVEGICRQSVRKLLGDDSSVNFLALYRLCRRTEIDHLCDLNSLGISFQTIEGAKLEDRAVVEIDRRTYFPVSQTDRPVRIKKNLNIAHLGRDALDAYSGTGMVSCHRDSFDLFNQRIRHHAIFFDVSCILSTERFRERLGERIEQIGPPPAIIVVPPHREGVAFAKEAARQIKEVFNVDTTLFVERDVANPRDPELTGILAAHNEGDSVLIVDDVSVSGERLITFSRDFRRIEYRGKQRFIVGIAKPESEQDWKERKIQLKHREGFAPKDAHSIWAIETIVMPDWGEHECPWCREEGLLRRLSLRSETVPKFVQERLRVLQQRDGRRPLVNDVFLEQDPVNRMSLTTNSIFLNYPASQADVSAAVAHRLALLRADGGLGGLKSSGFPDRAIVDMNCYLGGWFSDSVLRAALLRLTSRPEVEYSKYDDEQKRHTRLKGLLLSDDAKAADLALELMLGMAVRHLPKVQLSETEKERLAGKGLLNIGQSLMSAFDGISDA